MFGRSLRLLVPLMLLASAAAAQQSASDPWESARVRLGPLAFTPTIAIKDVGVDTNVFYEFENPKRDFTATASPGAEFWFRFGRARLAGKGTLSYVYFHKYHEQGGLNGDVSGRFEFPLARIRPYVGLSYANVRDRSGYDIDIRSRHEETSVSGGLDVLVSDKTTIGASVRREWTRYAGDEEFLGRSLADAFDGWRDTAEGVMRYHLTPLTTLSFTANVERERFTFEPERDSDTLRLLPGVEFSPFALIRGKASVGVRRFNVLDPRIPDFTGVVASAGLSYTLLGVTKFDFRADRDVSYSYTVVQPYYVTTTFGLTVTQQVHGACDVHATGDRQRLEYRAIEGVVSPVLGHVDVATTYGGGIGYRLGGTGRLGFNITSVRRTSPYYVRTFKGLRYMASFTYGQ